MKADRYFVQSISVRGEGRVYFVADSEQKGKAVTEWSRAKKQVERRCQRMNNGLDTCPACARVGHD